MYARLCAEFNKSAHTRTHTPTYLWVPSASLGPINIVRYSTVQYSTVTIDVV